jgi:hypothetical protein
MYRVCVCLLCVKLPPLLRLSRNMNVWSYLCTKYHMPVSSDSLANAVTQKDPDSVPPPLCWKYSAYNEYTYVDGLRMFVKKCQLRHISGPHIVTLTSQFCTTAIVIDLMACAGVFRKLSVWTFEGSAETQTDMITDSNAPSRTAQIRAKLIIKLKATYSRRMTTNLLQCVMHYRFHEMFRSDLIRHLQGDLLNVCSVCVSLTIRIQQDMKNMFWSSSELPIPGKYYGQH